ncbi:MAG: hypothetical protein E6R04_03160 [Spirochaetes bacterium]|nr:MAG: hypothetical protein E6R04_03160 [Spirochaetota bacterium]
MTRPPTVAGLLLAAALITSCSAHPVPPPLVEDQSSVSSIKVRGVANTVNELVVKALDDVMGFWENDTSLKPPFTPPGMFVAVDSPRQSARGCSAEVSYIAYCGDGIIWNVTGMSKISELAGELAVTFMVADTLGMYIQRQQGLSISYETAADCLAGVYLHYVDNGDSTAYPTATSKDTATGVGAGLVALTGNRTDDHGEDVTDGVLETRMHAFGNGLNGTPETCLSQHARN